MELVIHGNPQGYRVGRKQIGQVQPKFATRPQQHLSGNRRQPNRPTVGYIIEWCRSIQIQIDLGFAENLQVGSQQLAIFELFKGCPKLSLGRLLLESLNIGFRRVSHFSHIILREPKIAECGSQCSGSALPKLKT